MMKNLTSEQLVLSAQIGALLLYPDEEIQESVGDVEIRIQESDPEASVIFGPFVEEMRSNSLGHMQEEYNRAFELLPASIPYAGIHAFGQENFARGELLARLTEEFVASGVETGSELPDHIAILLQSLSKIDRDKADEIIEYLLPKMLERIEESLNKVESPYRFPITAVRRFLYGIEGAENNETESQ